MAVQLYTQPNKSSLSAAKFFSSISNLHKYLLPLTFHISISISTIKPLSATLSPSLVGQPGP
ncbi:hypothetical protein C347_06835 [Cryptococcus neoformans AD2-60a]|nr:hypothetical protein C347_06835 [Cryptococcus neoformans var. grubii AD2-60a]